MGSIPACAGEPQAMPPSERIGTVYPRVCGGALNCGPTGNRATGLSPRVRGSHLRTIRGDQRPRSIPACAGEPTGCLLALHCLQVYPRVCGGAFGQRRIEWTLQGLSPRVRGATGALREGFAFWVYPRVCGGAQAWKSLTVQAPGLSPRVRGSRCYYSTPKRCTRSIPACAGEPE